MSKIIFYSALAVLGAVLILSPKGKQTVNNVVDAVKPKPTKPTGVNSTVKPTIIGSAPLPTTITLPTKPTTTKPPATTPTGSKKTSAVELPDRAEVYRAQIKSAAFAENLPFTLLIAFCETVNPHFDPNLKNLDRRLVASSAVITAASGNSMQQELLASRYGLSQVALIHAQQMGYKGSPAQLYQVTNSLNYGAKYLKKCLGLFTTSDRQIRAFVAYFYGYDAAKSPNAEHLAFAKKIYARWQELES
jgi:hypothetical protein